MASSYGLVTESNITLKCLGDQDDKGAVVANLIYAFWLCTIIATSTILLLFQSRSFPCRGRTRGLVCTAWFGLSHGQME